MDNDKASPQVEPADETEVPQPAHSTPPPSGADTPVRGAQKGNITRRSGSERLLGLEDPKPELTERPVARKRRAPRPKPVAVAPEWVDAPTYDALVAELGDPA